MSSRALRRLQGRGNVMALPPVDQEESESDEEETVNHVVNKFALLDDSDEKSDEQIATDVVKQDTAVNKKKKNRKKKKKKATTMTPTEDLDKVLEEIESNGQVAPSTSHQRQDNLMSFKFQKSVLTVEHRHLNPDNELRKIFGTRALMGDSSYRRRNQGSQSRGMWLTQPQNNWAKLGRTGISMKSLETKNGCQVFKFEHSKDYQDIQFKFLDAVDSSDHRNIAVIIEKHSYHVDALLTFSDVYKVHEDIRMARELIERSLYCLERSFHSCFNLTTGMCRLPYKYQENRCLYLSLYKHMNFVSQRGCNRTALELCKVLLSLDPEEDPLGSILELDHFALRAAEYEYLIKFASEWGVSRNLTQLPNWAYSLALAHFQLSLLEKSSDKEKADKALQNALIMFPSVLALMLEKCSVQPDPKVAACAVFASKTKESRPQGLELLCHMFVCRNHSLWKDPEILAWLESNVNAVISRVEKKDRFVDECAQKRKTRYQKPPMNIYRHALISELPEVSSLLPLDIRTGTMLSHDPLPPQDTVISYQRPARSSHGRSRHPVSLFFHSLLPGFNPEEPFDGAPEYLDRADAGQMRGNVQTLMNAMRELLDNFQRPLAEDEEEEFVQDWD
ncbi:ribosome quality control complex subunit TCF25-like isoform X2 [Clavelina lepadiformis]|uniref:ribosome quality control complex subunit TCF25-like isoform X2 n=1 Tax=Clavelina lepadiformis TaxID=159417 RepID=UPI004041A5CE